MVTELCDGQRDIIVCVLQNVSLKIGDIFKYTNTK